jgi:hypothetical protein
MKFAIVQLVLEKLEVPLDDFVLVRSEWHVAFLPQLDEMWEEKDSLIDPNTNFRR